MGISSKISDWRAKFFLWVGLPIIAVIGFVAGTGDLVPAWQAHGGGGTSGSFTAERQECSRRSCTWYGDFTTDAGATRTDVILYDAPDGLSAGETAPARDTGAGDGVFSTSGGSTWLLVTGLTLAGLVAAVAWVIVILREVRRRRERRATDEAFLAATGLN
ncbi:hypothetical protein D7147_03470 [Micromonospora musae]|uniref:Uncharacterized protein n=1 Tax=Micromonospora musae TaxID=1894970 RepID=A0A3A9Y2I4_9ACTN|nr:hypothetical protein [Micromonospora musae]RKN24074.1 hypothetical protein D7147_03470 [Micromonospora musae]RKN31608.1 hypothetical protein D7044_14935 [Micromonospora musae]